MGLFHNPLRFCALMLGLSVSGAFAQAPAPTPTTVLVEPPAPLLPDHPGDLIAINASHGDASAASFSAGTCEPLANAPASDPACAGILKEDGLLRYAIATYQRGTSKTEAFALEFQDATDALSAYTFYRSLMKDVRISGAEAARLGKSGSEMSTDSGGILVWAGTAVLRVKGHLSTEETIVLTSALPKVGGRRGLAPLLPTMLPPEGLQTSSMRYSVGPASYQAMKGFLPADILGWDKSAEVVSATYKGKGTVTLLLYPTPQIAGNRGRAIQAGVNSQVAAALPANFGTVEMRRVGPLLGITSGAWTVDQAKTLLAQIHFNEEVSFDQKMPLEFHAEVRKTATLLQSIAIFSGVLILAAILLGLFLGGARAGIRVLMGKPAASEPEFLTIDLRDRADDHFKKLGSDNTPEVK